MKNTDVFFKSICFRFGTERTSEHYMVYFFSGSCFFMPKIYLNKKKDRKKNIMERVKKNYF